MKVGNPGQGAVQRGLLRLMLKLPSVRGELQMRLPRSEALKNLCEAYEVAYAELQSLRANPVTGGRVEEYATICDEIESDVIAYLVNEANVRK